MRGCAIAEVKPAIFGHAEFTAFNAASDGSCSRSGGPRTSRA